MKLIKWALALAVLLGVVITGGSLLLPASSHVERSVIIHRSPAQVFAVLNSFEQFNQWSPWAALDPQATYRYAGPSSGKGATMSWSGTPAIGNGRQEILESIHDRKVTVALDFEGNRARSTYTLTPLAEGTRVTWAFDSDHGFNPMARWFGLLFERMLGPDFENGLQRLKALLESAGPAAAAASSAESR
ncbi:SRPBCC family protein [Pseudoxanthomonas dokdonensis]|uniref:Polyketide cyclase n=1 Tax=Pseudoxanthomonas dokdonensis TaxID=344882 RepID=A0A0R0CJS6_9GAMM|nr:SRPBCC family protein [Pseudoxanthomonas dokdonensis]KRG70127.1 hypothetical protein ABB29_07860 [Pseudoxanthomonas dokdonensis]